MGKGQDLESVNKHLGTYYMPSTVLNSRNKNKKRQSLSSRSIYSNGGRQDIKGSLKGRGQSGEKWILTWPGNFSQDGVSGKNQPIRGKGIRVARITSLWEGWFRVNFQGEEAAVTREPGVELGRTWGWILTLLSAACIDFKQITLSFWPWVSSSQK